MKNHFAATVLTSFVVLSACKRDASSEKATSDKATDLTNAILNSAKESAAKPVELETKVVDPKRKISLSLPKGAAADPDLKIDTDGMVTYKADVPGAMSGFVISLNTNSTVKVKDAASAKQRATDEHYDGKIEDERVAGDVFLFGGLVQGVSTLYTLEAYTKGQVFRVSCMGPVEQKETLFKVCGSVKVGG